MKIKRMWPKRKTLNSYGGEFYSTVGRLLVANQVLDDVDRTAFETLCQVYSRMREADLQLSQEGLTIEGQRGTSRHPVYSIYKSVTADYIALLKQFGLSPKSRDGGKISFNKIDENDEKADFFKQKITS